jgi:hypothetical protein
MNSIPKPFGVRKRRRAKLNKSVDDLKKMLIPVDEKKEGSRRGMPREEYTPLRNADKVKSAFNSNLEKIIEMEELENLYERNMKRHAELTMLVELCRNAGLSTQGTGEPPRDDSNQPQPHTDPTNAGNF